MATNLRITSITAIDNLTIQVIFTDNLNLDIDTDNVFIQSQTVGVPNPDVLKVNITGNVIQLTVQPLTALAVYYFICQSTNNASFKSLNGNAFLIEDGIANQILFLGPTENTNPVKEYLLNYLRGNVYNIESGTVISNYLDVITNTLSYALYDVRQARNENYLSLTITDEQKTRGASGFDHLDQEGAYEVLRVATTKTGSTASNTLSFDNLPEAPISLLQTNFSDNLTTSSENTALSFNVDNLFLTLSKRFIIIVNSIIFLYTDNHPQYIYDIEKYGYQILDSKYDPDFAFKYLLLNDNQIKINDKILDDPNFTTKNIFQVQVSYKYKDTGKFVDVSSVIVSGVFSSGREVLPPIENIFNLKHAPIISASNTDGSLGDVSFVNQNTLPTIPIHPAFVNEIPFRLEILPAKFGDYSVDYETGTVYVYGEDTTTSGTGATPPLAIYKYRVIYKEDIDYIVDPDTMDFAGLKTGSIIDQAVDIDFNYEPVLAQGIDYQGNVHTEVLGERINNNLLALNTLGVANTPITNVFRIFNETSGEIYQLVRWNDSKVFFSYNTPPKLESITNEKISFKNQYNELLFINSIIDTSDITFKIYKILLSNNNIINQSEDAIGSFINSSASFSDTSIFSQEQYFDNTITTNLSRIVSSGQYQIDYANGVVYVGAAANIDTDIGSISYKYGFIETVKPHITSVENIYSIINTLGYDEQVFDFVSFGDSFVVPKSFNISDEQFLNNNTTSPYLISNNEVGTFIDADFVSGVSNNIQFVRGLFEKKDLLNNTDPINFVEACAISGKNITISSIVKNEYHNVNLVNGHYTITLNTELEYLSSNITLNITVQRLSDSANLWSTPGTINLGNPFSLILSGAHSPANGDSVLVSYSYQINDLSTVIVDYSKGNYSIDYTALTDEILVSYEYGRNELDFRKSNVLSTNDTYFVSYKVGALRDALLKNFGSLIDIKSINNFDVSFDRERYRDALIAAMQSFALGPTVPAIKNIADIISHVPSEVIEAAFATWVLGIGVLNPKQFDTSSSISLQPAAYNNGVSITSSDDILTLPAISNFKLDAGTFETWVSPNWNGLDNLATLQITPYKDGYVASELEIFIGAREDHPVYEIDPATNIPFFSLNKDQQIDGIPNQNKNGIYFYYTLDHDGTFSRWFIDVIDGYADGYNKIYKINIKTPDGKFYDVKSSSITQPITSTITTGNNTINFVVNSMLPNEGITFVADVPRYIIDLATTSNQDRFSIFKDETGYLNFKVFDSLNNSYTISTDVSSWRKGDNHHIATSWRLNSIMGRDELHLFVDGFEVPNIIRYGDRIKPYLHEKFRTVNPEEIAGVINKNIVSSIDLITTFGSNQVSSSLDFNAYGINISDTIYIEESGFNVNGYSITNVNGNTLTLNTTMPTSLTDGAFTINKVSFNVSTEIDVYNNITISLLHQEIVGFDLITIDGYSTVNIGFDPASLPLTGWWRDYAGIPWLGSTSIGISGSENLTSATPAPLTVSSLFGHGIAVNNGANQILSQDIVDIFFNPNAWSVFAYVRIDSIPASGTSYILDDPDQWFIISAVEDVTDHGNAIFNVSQWNSSLNGGLGGYITAGINTDVPFGTFALVQAKYDGTNLSMRIDDGSWVSSPTTSLENLANQLRISAASNNTIAELGVADFVMSDDDFDRIFLYITNRYSNNPIANLNDIAVGSLIKIDDDNFDNQYTILSIDGDQLTLNDTMPLTAYGLPFSIYSAEEEIPGQRALRPAYQLSKDGYFNNILTITDKALANDIVAIRTLGLNHRRVRRKHYVWGNQSNILKTRLPAPVSLEEVNFRKILLDRTYIGSSNATLTGSIFASNNLTTDQPSNPASGRTLSVSIFGDNVDFSADTVITIDGTIAALNVLPIHTTEILTFTEAGTQDTINQFANINYINVVTKPINPALNAAVIEVKEKYTITHLERPELFTFTDGVVPNAIARYSYQVNIGSSLFSDGYQGTDGYIDGYLMTDNDNFFSDDLINDYLIIHSPSNAVNYYQILDVSLDHHTLTVQPNIPPPSLISFVDGYYEILKTTTFRNGLQNGFFVFEYANLPQTPFILSQGLYELDYYTYLNLPFNINHNNFYIGSNFEGINQFNGTIDELQILNIKLTDTRVGETIPSNQRSITKEFNSIKASEVKPETLILAHFDELPLINEADIYTTSESNIFQSGEVINENFDQSIVLTTNPLIVENNGCLDPRKEGTIEFWVNPIFDTANDPNLRYYFDASSIIIEEVVSLDNTTVQINNEASKILSIKLASGGQIDDFFAGGSITSDQRTLLLHRRLPNQNTKVLVSYIPFGLQGDRLSIFKDLNGSLNFNITAQNTNYTIQAPIFWERNSWHRIKASYKNNTGNALDEMHLFIDGYEWNNVSFGENLNFSNFLDFAAARVGPNQLKHNIKFKDPVANLFFGSDYTSHNSAYVLMDNIRLSNIMRPLYKPYGEAIDPNYSSNIDVVFPITQDLNTTLLIDGDTLTTKNTDFITLNDKNAEISNFTVNVYDRLDIINSDSRVKEVLEDLINAFKPAHIKSFIFYK